MKKQFSIKKLACCLCCLALVLSLFTACGEKPEPVYVQTVAEIMGYSNSGAFNISSGIIMAQEEVKVERDMDKEIAGLCVEEGQTVNEGDVLFIYKTANVSLLIDKAALEIEQIKNTISDLKNQIAQLEKEKKTAKESEKLAYTLQIQSLQTDQKEAEYNLSIKEKELQALKNNTDTGEIKSPITGQVKQINKDGGYDPYTGSPLPYIVLARVGEYRIKGSVNELNREELYAGQSVIIRSRIDNDMTWTGTITSVENQAQDNNDYFYGTDEMYSSSSYPFYVTPDNSEGMLLGQHVFIEPNYGQTTAGSGLWLDAAYICMSQSDGTYFVWGADKNDKLARLHIEVGTYDGTLNRYEILGGLSKTDRIAFPNEDIQEGAPVTEILAQPPVEDALAPDGDMTEGEIGDGEDLPVDDGIGDMTPEFGDIPVYDGDNELPMDPVEGDPLYVELPEDFFDNEAAPPIDNGGGA